MRLGDMYRMAVQKGIDADCRGPEAIEAVLGYANKAYEALPEDKKWEFDLESLTNPYADTRILAGSAETQVNSILVGIDMGVSEVLLANALRDAGRGVDLILAHHPEGSALARLQEVMGLQADVWRGFGVPISYGDAVMQDRMGEVMRSIHPRNNERAVSAAELLGFPYMCCHTPADNCVNSYLQRKCDSMGTDGTVDDLVEALKEIPEYRAAVLQGMGPVIFEGSGSRRTGRIMVDMTGGTSGPVESISRLAAAGVGTIVGMHMGEEHRKKAKDERISVVIAGHISSDSLGMNLIVDEYERQGVEVVACSGFTRVSRA